MVGSLGTPSCTVSLSKLLVQNLTQLDIDSEILYLNQLNLPIGKQLCVNSLEPDEKCIVDKFLDTINKASGIVLATPVYHGSYSALLKNAIDYLPYAAFSNKPIAVLANAGSPLAAINATSHLDAVIRALQGYSLRYQISTSPQDFSLDEANETYLVKNQNVLVRCQNLALEMKKFINFCQLP